MTGTRGGLGRIVAMAIALAIGLLLLAAREAGAGFYTVVQCGWGAGVDAAWSTTARAARLEAVNRCSSDGGGPGGILGTATIPSAGEIAGGQFGAWRWVAPAGVGIVGASGIWSHSLHGGIVNWLVAVGGDGTAAPFATAVSDESAAGTNAFAVSFPTPSPAFEDRLLCPQESNHCIIREQSSESLSALFLRLQDLSVPQVESGGQLFAGGWRRGVQGATVAATDAGSGLSYDELRIDGETVSHVDLPCAETDVGGVVATRMQPCQGSAANSLETDTVGFADGPHEASTCAADFAGNVTCTADRDVLFDNTPPGPPRAVMIAGGGGRGPIDRFDVTWANPDQHSASPVAAALWRVTGPAGYDTGVEVRARPGISALDGLEVPAAGVYVLRLWLRDEAGNGAPASAVSLQLRESAGASETKSRGGPKRRHRGGPDGSGSGQAGGGRGKSGAGSRPGLLVRLAAEAPNRAGQARRRSRRDGSLTVPFGTGATVSGRLVGSDGSGIARRRVRVVAHPWLGALTGPAPVTVTTGRRGGFDLQLAPGPSRRIVVHVVAGEGHAPAPRHLDLRVRSGISLSATPRALATGQEVHLSGRVHRRGTRLPRPGKLVAIQYLEAATHRWRPALVVRSDRRGRFDTSYRFRYVSGTARIQLRATALAEERWPYAPGSSVPVIVDVHSR